MDHICNIIKKEQNHLMILLLSVHFRIVRPVQQKIHRNLMEIRDFCQRSGGDINVSSFIIAVHPLTARQNLPHLCLCQIPIFS